MYLDFDNGLARERAARVREEVARDRLGARSVRAGRPVRAARSDGDGVVPRGKVARGAAAFVTALFT